MMNFAEFKLTVTKDGFGNVTAKNKLAKRVAWYCSDVRDFETYGEYDEDDFRFTQAELEAKTWPQEVLDYKNAAMDSGWEFNL